MKNAWRSTSIDEDIRAFVAAQHEQGAKNDQEYTEYLWNNHPRKQEELEEMLRQRKSQIPSFSELAQDAYQLFRDRFTLVQGWYFFSGSITYDKSTLGYEEGEDQNDPKIAPHLIVEGTVVRFKGMYGRVSGRVEFDNDKGQILMPIPRYMVVEDRIEQGKDSHAKEFSRLKSGPIPLTPENFRIWFECAYEDMLRKGKEESTWYQALRDRPPSLTEMGLFQLSDAGNLRVISNPEQAVERHYGFRSFVYRSKHGDPHVLTPQGIIQAYERRIAEMR